MTHPFGDSEPDDAWSASDDPLDQLDNLRRRVEHLGEPIAAVGHTPDELVALIGASLQRLRHRRGDLTDRQLERLKLAGNDLQTVRERLSRG